MLIDIDHFKAINDTHGHAVGDEVIKSVAQLIKEVCRRGSDVVARIGGEEFAVIFSTRAPARSSELAEQIRQTIEALEITYDNASIQVTASIGVATMQPSEDQTELELFKAADANLYKAKASGRNTVVISEQ